MPKRVTVFYAYPNDPPSIGESITSALSRLSATEEIKQKNIRFKKWTDNAASGSRLISNVLGQIDRCQVFSCDLTYPNANVSFELGYSIARYKRLFTTINPSISDADKSYRRIYFSLLNMAYAKYENHENLAEAFLSERPWQSLGQTLLHENYRQQVPRPENPTVMYIKPPVNTDSVIATTEELRRSVFGESIIIDDPNEYSSQSLEWYAEKLLEADVVVIHLLSTDHEGYSDHNLKASIVAGLAHGFGRQMMMLAHAPYKSPIDYDPWLSVHDTAEACVTITKTWLESTTSTLTRRRPRRQRASSTASRKLDLRSLFLGDPVAEHEAFNLHEYFVETDAFLRAMDGPLTILVGRRGTGKTAILYAINGELKSNRASHVTIFKPVSYETHGLLRVLEEVRQRSERGFLIESLWKFLIYSEVASSLALAIRDRPVHIERTVAEDEFLEYYEGQSNVLRPPISERLQNAVTSLQGVGGIADAQEQRFSPNPPKEGVGSAS